MRDSGGVQGDLPLQMLQARRVDTGQLQGEIWRLFLFFMLLLLAGEGLLIKKEICLTPSAVHS